MSIVNLALNTHGITASISVCSPMCECIASLLSVTINIIRTKEIFSDHTLVRVRIESNAPTQNPSLITPGFFNS